MEAPRSVGPYQVLALLGAGGMGAVYRARHRDVPVERALKVLSGAAVDARRLARFEREGRNLARVQHENVVRVHEAGADGGRPYLVMDLVEGRGLERVLAAGRLPLERALALGLGVARGVAALHAAGIVHRDLKPENVLVRHDGAPVVVDLGLALAPDLDERLTRTGALMGTPVSMAPEQLMARPAGPQVDVWALGLLLFHLLSGRSAVPPVDSIPELVHEVTRSDRPRLGSVDPELPAALEDLVARMLDRAPERRPADAREVVAALEAVADARARGALRSAGSARRRRRAALLALAAVVAFVGGGAASAGLRAAPAAPPPPPDAPPPATAAPSPEAVTPVAPSPQVAEAARELRRLGRLEDEAARLEGVEAWLARWPDHPDRAEALLVRARAPRRRLQGEGRLTIVRFVDDRRFVVTSTVGLQAFDADTGETRLASGHGGAVCAAPAGGRVLLAAGPVAHVLGGDLGRRPLAVLRLGATVISVGLSPDGSLAACGDEDGVVRVLETSGGRVVATLPGHRKPTAVALTADGRLAITGSGSGVLDPGEPDTFVRLWRLPDGTLSRRVALIGAVWALAVRPGGDEVVAGTSGGRVYVVSLSRDEPPRELVGQDGGRGTDVGSAARAAHEHAVRDVACSPDGRWAWSVSQRELRCWDLVARRERYVVLGGRDRLRSVDVAPGGRRLVTSCEGGAIELWALPD